MDQSPPPNQGWSDPPRHDTPPAAPAAPSYGTSTAVVVERPGMLTAGAIVLIVLGALTVLFGVLALLGGAVISGSGEAFEAEMPGMEGMAGALGGVALIFGAILVIWGIAEIWAGAAAMGGRGWARILGIVLSAIAVLLFVFGLIGSLGAGTQQEGAMVNLIINLVILIAYLFVIWTFATSGAYFAARRRT